MSRESEILTVIIVLSIVCCLFGFTLCCCDMNNPKLNKNRQNITITIPSPV